MEKIITFAVPCYNSAAYMDHCVQTLLTGGDDIEIILVDDGSTKDDTPTICDRYAAVDRFSTPLSAAALKRLAGYDRVIAAVYTDDAAAREQMSRLSSMPGLVAVFMVNPYKMNKFAASLGSAPALVIAYDDLPSTRRAAAMAIFGGIDVGGRLPVDLPRIAPIGSGIDIRRSRLGYSSPLAQGLAPSLTDSIDSIVGAAIAAGAMPGAQVLVARHGKVVHSKSYGRLGTAPALGAPSPRVADTTLYDLASVSKAAGTLPGIMKAVECGALDLDAPASRYIPGLRGTPKDAITLRSLLYHESGMPPALDMYRIMMDTATYTGRLIRPRRDRLHTVKLGRGAWGHTSARARRDITSARRSDATPHAAARGIWVGDEAADTLMQRIYDIPLRSTSDYTYSCLNFCLLLDAEQRATGRSHERWVADSIWAPMGLRRLAYRPSERFALRAIAPTEHDRFLRRQTVHGYVHDETAAYMGGVSGNAGLFGNAADLAALCQMWLQDGRYGDAQIIDADVAPPLHPLQEPHMPPRPWLRQARRRQSRRIAHMRRGIARGIRPPGIHRHRILGRPRRGSHLHLPDQPRQPHPRHPRLQPPQPPPRALPPGIPRHPPRLTAHHRTYTLPNLYISKAQYRPGQSCRVCDHTGAARQ